MGLNGAEIVFNPSAVIAGPNDFLWKIEPPALAVANGYFVAAINRVGTEAPWNLGEFFGQSYFCNPRGKILAEASRNQDEIVTADLDLDLIAEVRRAWPFYRDRRPELYGDLVKPAAKLKPQNQRQKDRARLRCGSLRLEYGPGLRRIGLCPPVPSRIFCCGTPLAKYTITAATRNMHPDYSIFEGFEVTGNARHVFSRGEWSSSEARLIAAAGRGRYLHREVAAQ